MRVGTPAVVKIAQIGTLGANRGQIDHFGGRGLETDTPQGVILAAFKFSEDDGTRTRNHRIDSPVL